MRKSVLIASAALLLAGCPANSSTAASTTTATASTAPSASAEPDMEVKTGIEDVDQ
jgi:uncharacterized lipoprotein YajG